MQVWQMVRALLEGQRLMKLCANMKSSKCPTQHGENFEVRLFPLHTSYSEYTSELFLLQAENIYNDEDPDGAADSEVQA